MRLSVGMKIGGGFLILVVLLSLITVQGVHVMNSTDKDLHSVDVLYDRVTLDYQIKNSFQNVALAIRGYTTYGDAKFLDEYTANVVETKKLINERISNSSPEEQPKYEKVLLDFQEYDQSISQKMIPLLKEQKTLEATAVGSTLTPITASINQTIQERIDENRQTSEKEIQRTIDTSSKGRQTVITFSLIAILLGVISAVLITRSITESVKKIQAGIKHLAVGDFTQAIEVKTKDEIGELAASINQTREQLKNLITEITEVAQSVAAHSQQLAASAQEVTGTAEEVASTTSEVAAMAEKSLENASITAEESVKVIEVATSGGNTVMKTTDKINHIARSVDEANESIQHLGTLSAKIGNITNVITGIADQTNLLALNAAIEAARAGDQGRGFAVVADEVRKLAEQSATAAKEIGQIISQIQSGINSTISFMEQGSSDVQEGVALAHQAGIALTISSKP
ncbi:hypothetical protein N752_06890 [Desulforamulus aquiferis]|nr:methyl-accepting chemotaxis protein [Desulforamulus aquiferis]RYD05966.1 hypothetical protein N752_06890 [Desulforamulus aquiferis]